MSASLTYQRSLSEGGSVNGPTTPTGFISREGFNAGASVNQFLWDFGRTTGRWRSAQQSAQAQRQTEHQTLLDVLANVRTAYFNVLAQQSLVQVAQETLENEKARLGQVNAQVQVGTRPEIDLLQQRTAVANAQVQLIQARNNAATSKAQLNQAMGLEGPTDYSDALHQQVRLEVERAQLAVNAARESVSATEEALPNAREQPGSTG